MNRSKLPDLRLRLLCRYAIAIAWRGHLRCCDQGRSAVPPRAPLCAHTSSLARGHADLVVEGAATEMWGGTRRCASVPSPTRRACASGWAPNCPSDADGALGVKRSGERSRRAAWDLSRRARSSVAKRRACEMSAARRRPSAALCAPSAAAAWRPCRLPQAPCRLPALTRNRGCGANAPSSGGVCAARAAAAAVAAVAAAVAAVAAAVASACPPRDASFRASVCVA